MTAIDTRALVRRLVELGVFYEYKLNVETGERITVVQGRDTLAEMSVGTAKAYAERMESKRWGFVK